MLHPRGEPVTTVRRPEGGRRTTLGSCGRSGGQHGGYTIVKCFRSVHDASSGKQAQPNKKADNDSP